MGHVAGNGAQRRPVRNIHRHNNRGESSCCLVSSKSALNDNVHAQDHGFNIHSSRNIIDLFQEMSPFHQAFCAEIDKLSIVQMCNVCLESYEMKDLFV